VSSVASVLPGSSEARRAGLRSGPLENYANRVAPAGQSAVPAADWRAERWAARGALWEFSTLDRVRKCGRVTRTADGSVQVRANGSSVGFGGLCTCGSWWACPVCNAKISATRRLEVGTALAWAVHSGGAAFGAYTLRHHQGTDADALWRGLSKCWQAVARDKTVRNVRTSLGLVGTVRAAEVVVGDNGPHPHLHPVHLFERPVSDDGAGVLHEAQFGAWSRAADRLGFEPVSERAQHLHVVGVGRGLDDLGEYFTKATYRPAAESVGWEMASPQTKSRTRAKGAAPFELLGEFHRNGDVDALDDWRAYERYSKGKRALTWTKGLRSRVGLDVEAADEDLADAEVGTREDCGLVVTDWSPVVASRGRLGAGLLSAVGPAGNWDEGRRYCDANGIEWRNA